MPFLLYPFVIVNECICCLVRCHHSNCPAVITWRTGGGKCFYMMLWCLSCLSAVLECMQSQFVQESSWCNHAQLNYEWIIRMHTTCLWQSWKSNIWCICTKYILVTYANKVSILGYLKLQQFTSELRHCKLAFIALCVPSQPLLLQVSHTWQYYAVVITA